MRLAINGYGRIGRCILRAAMERDDTASLQFIAVNELAEPDAIAYLTRYDSTHGRFLGKVEHSDTQLTIESSEHKQNVRLLNQADAASLPWSDCNIDLVLECTGRLTTVDELAGHLSAGAKKVLLSNPGSLPIPAIVYGVNHHQLKADMPIVSAASCTSNALVPFLYVLQQVFGIDNGVITTIHASMHDQPVIDAYHNHDLRKNRAASSSVIPVATGLAAGIARIMPELEGCFAAHALRVPVNNVSALNVTLNLKRDVSVKAVNEVLAEAAATSLSGVLGYTEERLASCDFNHDRRSGIIDANQTRVSGNKTVNLLIWFDNEWAFANRMLDLALHISHLPAA